MTTAERYDSILWALCVWREGRGESTQGKVAIAWTIRNRALDAKSRWPKSAGEVVLQPYQFSAFLPSDPNASKLPKPADKSWLECCKAVDLVMSRQVEDPTGGANHYHALPPGDKQWPDWARPSKQTAHIGRHRFYRL